MATSTYFGWTEPNDTDLVKNGAAAMRTLGNAIDSTLWTVGGYTAGKNKIINGDFGIWQRGTSKTVTSEDYLTVDRFRSTYVGGGATVTWSQQTFTPGAAPVAGYEGAYFSRMAATSGSGTTVIGINQRIEDVRTLAGQTATFSFWAKADSARTATILGVQDFGSGGSSQVFPVNTTQALTTGWNRYSFTFSMPSISGKTIGSGSSVIFYVYYNTGQASGTPQLDLWGWQLEAGSTATPFQTATGTKQGELAACRRYYRRTSANATNQYAVSASGIATSTTNGAMFVPFDVPMRTSPSSVDYSTIRLADGVNAWAITAVSIDTNLISSDYGFINCTVASGLTQYRPLFIQSNASASAYLGFSAEL